MISYPTYRLFRAIGFLFCLSLLRPSHVLALGEITITGGETLTLDGVTSSDPVILETGIDTINTDSTTNTLSGIISGPGELAETGGGTLVLTGTNTYTGGTLIQGESTLVIENSSNLGSVSSTITFNNGTLETTSSVTLSETILLESGGTVNTDGVNDTLTGVISGPGELIKTGTGTLTLDGSNTYTGGTVIEEGILELGKDNALDPTGSVVVDSSGTLDIDSHQETLAALTNNGVTKLESGTLSVASYSGSGGTLSVNAHSAGKLIATGNANVSGTALDVDFGSSYIPTPGNSVTVVSAGSVTGQFTSVSHTAALSVTPTYTGTDVSFSVGEIPYNNTASGPNQTQIAVILDKVRDGATGDLATVTGSLNVLNSDQLRSAFDQMGPGSLQALTQLGTLSENAQFSSLVHRFDAIGSGASNLASGHFEYYDAQAEKSKPAEAVLAVNGSDLSGLGTSGAASESRLGYFASGVGSFGRLDGTSNASGQTPGYAFNTSGAIFGEDYRVSDELTVGGVGGYLQSHALSDLSASTVDNQSFKFGVYGVEHMDGWLANGYVGGADDLYSTTRNISFGDVSRSATASPKGQEFNTRWGLGYDHKTSWATLRPTLALEYDRVMVHSFDESGAGALDLNVGPQTNESLRTELGGRITKEYKAGDKAWVPYVSAAWQHEYLTQGGAINAQLASGGSAFTTQTADAGRDTALLGVGTTFQWNKAISFFFNYIAEVGRADFTAHNFDGGFRWRF